MKGHMTRRELLKALAAAAAPWTAPAPPGKDPSSGDGQARNPEGSAAPLLQVALLRCPDYDPAALAEAVREGWRLTQPPDVRGKRVLLKPNMVDVSPDRPIHTDPRLLEALALHLGDLGAREIVLAEATSHNRDSELLFRRSGYEALARRRGLRLVDLNYDDLGPVPNANPKATLLRRIHLPETVRSADVVISVAKMKTHKLAGLTLSLKNMFGVIPGMKYGWPKNVLHWNGIPLSVCEINATVKAHYAVIDGVVGMEGHGPVMGRAKKVGVLVMGANALAVDATAARVMGIDPARVDYLALAQTIKLGFLRRERIAVAGETIERVRTDFALDPDFAFLRAPRD